MVWKNYTASFESSKNNDLLQKRERQLWPMSVCRRCRIYSTYYSWFTETIPYTPRRGLPTMSKMPKVSQEHYISWRMHNLQFDISRIFDPESSKPQSCWSHTFWYSQNFVTPSMFLPPDINIHRRCQGTEKSKTRTNWRHGQIQVTWKNVMDRRKDHILWGRTNWGHGQI